MTLIVPICRGGGAIAVFSYGQWIAYYPEFIGTDHATSSFQGAIDVNGILTISSAVTGPAITLDAIISGPGIPLGIYITGASGSNWQTNLLTGVAIPAEPMTAVIGDVSPAQAQQYFNQATLYLRNNGTSGVSDAGVQLQLLNMLVSHFAVRYAVINSNIPAGVVGRLASANQGPVSMSWDANIPEGTAQWFAQTPYGFDFWAATAGLRLGGYYFRGDRTRNFNPWPFSRPGIGPTRF